MNAHGYLTREEILKTLAKRTCDHGQGFRQNIALLGEELSGKTTLLRSLLIQAPPQGITPIYVELVAFEFPLFAKRLLNNLLYNHLRRSQLISTRESLDNLAQRAASTLPQTSRAIQDILEHLGKERPEHILKAIFDALGLFMRESQQRCCVILDEFHHLKSLGNKDLCRTLGQIIMFQKDILFIFASSSRQEAKDILTNDLSLLFGNFETIELNTLNSSECETIIRASLGTVSIEANLIKFLVHFTGGQPFPLRLIADEAALICLSRGEAHCSKTILLDTLERLMFHDWGVFHMKFMTHLSLATQGRNKNELIYLLDAIAAGHNRLKDLTQHMAHSRAEIAQKLNRLVTLDVLSKNGSFYVINDRLMSFWLRYVHAEKLHSLTPDHSEQVLHFRVNLDAEIARFIETSQQDISQRVLELFQRFEGDEITLERKRLHLTSFKELRLLRFEGSDLTCGIFGRAHDDVWLAAAKPSGIEEKDVTALLKEAHKLKHKTIHKILVGLGGFERNARLLAQESKIATWETGHINNLLDLFGQPRIIP
jgi:hypothetical protein